MPNIIVKNKSGSDVIFYGIETVTFDCDDGTQAVFVFQGGGGESGTTATIDAASNLVLSNAYIDDDGNLVLTAQVDENNILTI